MRKSELNQQSVLAEVELLKQISAEPEQFKKQPELCKALRSQGGLAKYQSEPLGILSVSLNTQKSCAEMLLDGGFDELNRRRKDALSVLESKEGNEVGAKSTSTKEGLRKKVGLLESDVALLEQRNMLLSGLVSSLKDSLEHYAHKSGQEGLIEDFKFKNKKIEAVLNYALNEVIE